MRRTTPWRGASSSGSDARVAGRRARTISHLDPAAPENQAYYSAALEHRLSYGLFYLGLAAYLAVMTYDVHEMLSGTQRVGRG
jgi:hypothetical protein